MLQLEEGVTQAVEELGADEGQGLDGGGGDVPVVECVKRRRRCFLP